MINCGVVIMNKIFSLFSFMFLFIISGCSLFNQQTIDKVICRDVIRENLIDIIDVYNESNGTEVTVCGIISVSASENNFFIQDDSAGIYVNSNYFLDVTHANVGDTVVLKANKDTNKELVQLTVSVSSRYDVIDENSKRVEPIIIQNYFDLIKSNHKLVKLKNVNISEKVDNIIKIYDQDENSLVNIYERLDIELKNNVDIIGVYYNSDDRSDAFVVSDSSDIKASNSLTDEEKLNDAIYYEIPTTFNYDGPEFPTDSLTKGFWNREGGTQRVEFISCGDGDTATFLVAGPNGTKTEERVRFFGVDTEETHHPSIGAEEWGIPASHYTCNILSGGTDFYLQSDIVDGPRDDYDRLLGWIWVDGQLLQYNLVALGLADTKYTYFTGLPGIYDDILIAREEVAKNERIGKWSDLLDPYWDYELNVPKSW